jgi:HPt (histidine-containing phosphotransfer) domain-containing protein
MAKPVFIDKEAGIQRVMNNPDIYNRLLKKFSEKTSLEALRVAYAEKDQVMARVEMHTLKGVSANLSLTEMNRMAAEIEDRIKAGILDHADLSEFQACFSATVDAIQEITGHSE